MTEREIILIALEFEHRERMRLQGEVTELERKLVIAEGLQKALANMVFEDPSQPIGNINYLLISPDPVLQGEIS